MNPWRSMYPPAAPAYSNSARFSTERILGWAAAHPFSVGRYRKLNRKRKKLDDIIRYEKTIVNTDSLLTLIRMSPSEQKMVIDRYIVKLQEKAKAAALSKLQDVGNTLLMGSFYFYNSRQLETGNHW